MSEGAKAKTQLTQANFELFFKRYEGITPYAAEMARHQKTPNRIGDPSAFIRLKCMQPKRRRKSGKCHRTHRQSLVWSIQKPSKT